MKTKTWILLIAAVAVVCLGLSILLLIPGDAAAYAEISSGGTVIKTVDLRVDQQFSVAAENGGSNTVTVRDGRIAVTQASCPDHYCMDRGFCSSGTPIVCLPNRLVIRFVGEQPIDAVVR
ncbi:MAG: NusG domain II-containing protein [Faecousia sp.]